MVYVGNDKRTISHARLLLWTVVTLGLVAGACATQAPDIASTPSTQSPTRALADTGVTCFDKPSLDADATVPGFVSDDPVRACADLWRQGVVGTSARGAKGLLGCGAPHDQSAYAANVFPDDGSDVCARLGLDSLPPDYQAVAARTRHLVDELARRFGECSDQGEGLSTARAVLGEQGFVGWSVSSRGFTPNTSCSSFSWDAEQHVVLVVGDEE